MKKPTVPEVLPLVKAYYSIPGNSVGGIFHIVLDDGNVDDGDVEYCLNLAKEREDKESIEIGEILLRMSRTQRRKLYLSDKT